MRLGGERAFDPLISRSDAKIRHAGRSLVLAAARDKQKSNQQPVSAKRKRKSMKLVVVLLASSVILCGCAPWPPHQSKMQRHLAENKDAFLALESMIAATQYERVSVSFPSRVRADRSLSGALGYEYLDEADEWLHQFSTAKIMSVSYRGNYFMFTPSGPERNDGSLVEINYLHDSNPLDELRQCLPEHEKIRCGICVVPIDGHWWLRYRWFPDESAPEASRSRNAGEISSEQYSETIDLAMSNCWDSGMTKMGYELTGS